MKRSANGNHFLTITEGKRDPKTDELRKSWVLVFSEDFPAFFRLLQETAQFLRANPVSEEYRQRQKQFWAKRKRETAAAGNERS